MNIFQIVELQDKMKKEGKLRTQSDVDKFWEEITQPDVFYAQFKVNRSGGEDFLSRVMTKLDCCLCKNKGADQLSSYCEADQRLCFCYMDSTFPLLYKSKISSF